jgi:adenosyl cobinamide kinase/adenosyl cobinamide phosphate guanylyltransferase
MILILGGAYSGKSMMALNMAAAAQPALGGARVGFLEMVPQTDLPDSVRKAIEDQRAQRRAAFPDAVEILRPWDASQLAAVCAKNGVGLVVVDGLNLWLGHELTIKQEANPEPLLERHLRGECEHLVAQLVGLARSGVRLLVVSAVVNEGVTPAHVSGRLMRQQLSATNTRLAAEADLVCVMESGCARAIKHPKSWLTGWPGSGDGAFWPAVMVSAQAAAKVWGPR